MNPVKYFPGWGFAADPKTLQGKQEAMPYGSKTAFLRNRSEAQKKARAEALAFNRI